jgi:Family of unknown function (DUF6247)
VAAGVDVFLNRSASRVVLASEQSGALAGRQHEAHERTACRSAAPSPLDPERILRELPERERENFLSQYREALDGARDPAGWKHLRRVLRLWSWMVVAANQPGYYEAREQALAGTGEGMILEDYIRLRRGALPTGRA